MDRRYIRIPIIVGLMGGSLAAAAWFLPPLFLDQHRDEEFKIKYPEPGFVNIVHNNNTDYFLIPEKDIKNKEIVAFMCNGDRYFIFSEKNLRLLGTEVISGVSKMQLSTLEQAK